MADYSDQVVRIADLAADTDALEDLTFRGCVIVGPAVLVPMGCTFNDCAFQGDAVSMIWDIAPSREEIVGAIVLQNCTFEECKFTRIGLGFGPEAKKDYLAALAETAARERADEPVVS